MKRKFFTFTLVLLLSCFMATSVWAAKKFDFVTGYEGNYIQKMNGQIDHGRANMAAIFGLSSGEKFTKVRESVDFNSVSHARYSQLYKGIPVWGMETIVSRDHTDEVLRIDGSVVFDIPKDILNIPGTLDPQGALNRMKKLQKAKDAKAVWNFRNETAGTFIYIDKKGKANLVYVISYFADNEKGNPTRPFYFINVKTGKVIDSFEGLTTGQGTGPGGNLKIGQYTYNDSGGTYPGFGVTVNGSTCTMNTTNVKTVDLNHGTSGTTAFSYTCYNNTHENINGGYCPMNDAQYFGQVIYDMYQAWYSLPVLPFQLTMRCHYSTGYENAFWDGSSMTFGDGASTFYPLCCLDVSAHEVSHGFTQNHSNLTYSSQSGGMNESYSDMAGEAAKYYMRGTNDFMCGYDIFKAAGQALRYLCNPPQDGQSIDHVSEYYEGLDVHYSSGIYNKVFCLVAQSSGWTTRMAFDIFTKANTDYWTASETFASGANDVRQATLDYGYNCAAVASAFSQVGITITACPSNQPPVANFTGTPLSGTAPLTVQFTDTSSNTPTSWSWTFGDGGTSTVKNPSHVYNTAGTYTVSLTATNAYGSDDETKTGYITVTAPQPPVANFSGTPTTVVVGGSVAFTDLSTNSPTSWSWSFSGGTPSTSTVKNPTITYNTIGTFDVSLTATNAQGSDNETKVGYITVTAVPPDEIADAVDYAGLTFTKSGNANWSRVTDVYYYGGDSAKSGTITHSQSTTIETSITVASTQDVKFYWKVSSEANYDFLRFYIDGVQKNQISGEVNWAQVTNSIAAGTHTLKWTYSKDGSVNTGSDCGWVDKLELSTPSGSPIGEAVDYPSLTFVLSGNANWFPETTTTYYGGDAAQSGAIANNQSSTMETSVTVASTQAVKFYWKVSSEAGYDFLKFYIDGVEKTKIAGNIDWNQVSYNITAGTHTLKWSYIKDPYVASGSDCGWVDKLEITAPGTDPIAEAVDYPSLTFTMSGNGSWFSETTTTYYGGDAAQSADISDLQSTTMETSISGVTTVKFYWKVSSEATYDYLRFYIDGVEKAAISGTVNWTQQTYTVTSGSHTLKWSFIKDDYVSSGSDCGWVDKLELL